MKLGLNGIGGTIRGLGRVDFIVAFEVLEVVVPIAYANKLARLSSLDKLRIRPLL